MRSLGCLGSRGTKAAPDFSTASMATMYHAVCSKQSGTLLPGPMFATEVMYCASRFEVSSRSLYVQKLLVDASLMLEIEKTASAAGLVEATLVNAAATVVSQTCMPASEVSAQVSICAKSSVVNNDTVSSGSESSFCESWEMTVLNCLTMAPVWKLEITDGSKVVCRVMVASSWRRHSMTRGYTW